MATEALYKNYGVATVILARFVPFARTFAPLLAGVGKMKYRIFITFNVLGGVLTALFIPVHYRLWDNFPLWYHLLFLASLFPLTVLGALLFARSVVDRQGATP